ncbi:alanine dehydrogenase [Candidatus Woesearchaeota archaeon]|nr:alanine dehydrogenase [Candidatus Woesearchaeota archaeon]
MKIGVIKELLEDESRVALAPEGARELAEHGHTVLVEKDAGLGSTFTDDEYRKAGARIVSREQAWAAELVLKVKNPLKEEFKFFRKNQVLFTFLHLVACPKELTKELVKRNVIAIGYELVEKNEEFPLLAPMSSIAGKMAVQVGAHYLSKLYGGRGTLLDGIPGVLPANVMIIGPGTVGSMAARAAAGRGASVTILGNDYKKLKRIEETVSGRIHTLHSNIYTISRHIKEMDLVIGAVLVPGRKTPKIVTERMVKTMKPGSVIVDVSIDQGGCVETSKQTTHRNPIFVKHNVIHYCVSNMPAAYPRTSARGLTNSTLPYILKIANRGVIKAIEENPGLGKGVNTMDGFITNKAVVESLNLTSHYRDLSELI